MSITTYSELQTAVNNWLKRADTTRVKEFISLAEATIARKLRVREMEKRQTISITSEFFDLTTLTTRFIEMKNLYMTTDPKRSLEMLTPDQMTDFYSSSVSGVPRAFCIIGNTLRIAPSPDSTYSAQITYVTPITALSDSATTNWLLTNHPDIYLYTALYHGNLYIKDKEEAAVNFDLSNGLIENLNIQEKNAKYSGAPMRAKVRTGYY